MWTENSKHSDFNIITYLYITAGAFKSWQQINRLVITIRYVGTGKRERKGFRKWALSPRWRCFPFRLTTPHLMLQAVLGNKTVIKERNLSHKTMRIHHRIHPSCAPVCRLSLSRNIINIIYISAFLYRSTGLRPQISSKIWDQKRFKQHFRYLCVCVCGGVRL